MRLQPSFRLAAFIAGALWLASSIGWADDWPQWRGPDRTARSEETGLLDRWPEGGPPLLWTAAGFGDGYGAISTRDGVGYIQGTRGDGSMVYALDLDGGGIKWATRLGVRSQNDKGDGPRSTPTVEEDALYAFTGSGDLARLDLEDGSIVWHRNILTDFGAPNINWNLSESPLIDGDRLYIKPGAERATLAALDKKTGETIWTSKELSHAAGYASSIAVDVGGIRTIIGFSQSAGFGVRASDGKLLWTYEAPANGTANTATPVFEDNIAFFTSSYGIGGGAVELDVKGDRVEARELYFNRHHQNHHGGVVLVDGYVYGFTRAVLTCTDFKTGELMWRKRSVGKGSLIYADGHLYLLGENYTVGLAEATPEGYREKSRFSIEEIGRWSWAHPVVSNGRFYIRTGDVLACYDIAAGGSIRDSD